MDMSVSSLELQKMYPLIGIDNIFQKVQNTLITLVS